MGSWSVESFGNDTAGDWAFELEEAGDEGLDVIRDTLERVQEADEDDLEAPDAEAAIAAAEVVARLKGNFGKQDSYTETADAWVKAHSGKPPIELVELAAWVTERVLREPSELLELWKESGDFEAWRSEVHELKRRLEE